MIRLLEFSNQWSMKSKKSFENKIELIPFTDCWIWMGSVNKKGYGRLKADGKMQYAHRFSYSIYVGEIPKYMLVCHNCDNPPCVNPNHLFLGSDIDNVNDMIKKRRDRKAIGRNVWTTKLTKKQVLKIKQKYIPYKYSTYKLAKEYNVSQSTISDIVIRNASWKYL